VHGFCKVIIEELDKDDSESISKEEFKNLKCMKIIGGTGVKMKNLEQQVDLNELCTELKQSNVDEIFDKFDTDKNGVLDQDEMHKFFVFVVRQLSHKRLENLSSGAISKAASELVGIALGNLRNNYMTKKDFENFSDWLEHSLYLISTDDMKFIQDLLKDRTMPPNIMRILQAIVSKNRALSSKQMAFVREIIQGAKQAKRHSIHTKVRMCDELQRIVSMRLNKEISKNLPKGEVADLFSSMAKQGDMSEEMKEFNAEMQSMLGENPLATLCELSSSEAKKLERSMKMKATSKMTEMMVDTLMPGKGDSIKAALGSEKGYELAERIKAAVEGVLGYPITLAEMQKIIKPGVLDAGIRDEVNAAIHGVIDAELDAQREVLTCRLVKITGQRLREANYSKTSWMSVAHGCWTFLKLRLIMIGSLIGGVIIMTLGLLFDVIFGILNIFTCARVEKLVLLFILSLVITDTGLALFAGGIAGIVSPVGGGSSIGMHVVETLFDSKFYAQTLVRLEKKGLNLDKTLNIIFDFILKIVVTQLKAMNLLEILNKREEKEDQENSHETDDDNKESSEVIVIHDSDPKLMNTTTKSTKNVSNKKQLNGGFKSIEMTV